MTTQITAAKETNTDRVLILTEIENELYWWTDGIFG